MRLLFIVMFFLSGLCELALEAVWIRVASVWLGKTSVSAAIIIAIFFASAACGAVCGGWLASRIGKPARAYGLAELGVGVTAVAALFFADAIRLSPSWEVLCRVPMGEALAWVPVVLLAGPASFLSGMAFPFLCEAFVSHVDARTRSAGVFYAAGLAGASCGVLLGGILSPMAFGLCLTLILFSGLLACVGLAGVWLGGSVVSGGVSQTTKEPKKKKKEMKKYDNASATDAVPPRQDMPSASCGYALIIASGFLSVAAEVLLISYLMVLTSESVYSSSGALFAFVLSLGIGGAVASAIRHGTSQRLSLILFCCGALCALYPFALQPFIGKDIVPTSPTTVISAAWSAVVPLGMFLPLGICLGTVFPLAWELVERSGAQGRAMGRIIVGNKLAAAAGALAIPFISIPLLGLPRSLVAIGTCYAILGAVSLPAHQAVSMKKMVLRLFATAIAAAAAFAWTSQPVVVEKHSKVLDVVNDPAGVVAVIEDNNGSRHITLNQNYTLNGTGRALYSQRNEGWLPMLLCDNPRNVMFVGMASGISADAVLDFPVEKLDAVELLPGVATAARRDFNEWNTRLFEDRRARITIGDGRRVLRDSSACAYDAIICDLFLPWSEGASILYSREFFELARRRLTDRGVFCVWLPAYQMNEETAGIVIRTFLEVFENAIALRGNFDPGSPIIALAGSRSKIDISHDTIAARRSRACSLETLSGSPFIRSTTGFRLALLGDLRAAATDFSVYPINIDDMPVLAYRAPKSLDHKGRLRGITFLEWFGNRFSAREFPSCELGGADPAAIRRGIAAGNNYYAAAVMSVPLPEGKDLAERTRKAMGHFARGEELCPETGLRFEDLGR